MSTCNEIPGQIGFVGQWVFFNKDVQASSPSTSSAADFFGRWSRPALFWWCVKLEEIKLSLILGPLRGTGAPSFSRICPTVGQPGGFEGREITCSGVFIVLWQDVLFDHHSEDSMQSRCLLRGVINQRKRSHYCFVDYSFKALILQFWPPSSCFFFLTVSDWIWTRVELWRISWLDTLC